MGTDGVEKHRLIKENLGLQRSSSSRWQNSDMWCSTSSAAAQYHLHILSVCSQPMGTSSFFEPAWASALDQCLKTEAAHTRGLNPWRHVASQLTFDPIGLQIKAASFHPPTTSHKVSVCSAHSSLVHKLESKFEQLWCARH